MTIWDRGTYEELKWEPRKIEVRLHGERVAGPLRAVPDRQGRRAEGLDDPPHGPAGRPGGGAHARHGSCPMLARLGRRCRATTTAGPTRSSGTACARSPTPSPGGCASQSRNLNEITDRYPELSRLNRALSHHRAILDGEVVAFDADGRPSFGALQKRMHLGSESAGAAAGARARR